MNKEIHPPAVLVSQSRMMNKNDGLGIVFIPWRTSRWLPGILLQAALLIPVASGLADAQANLQGNGAMSEAGLAKMEARLTRQIRKELVMLPFYSVFDDLAYKVEGPVVTLYGSVTRPTIRTSAESAVKDIEGVEQVVNQIEVLPVSPNDDRIRLATYRSIYSHPALNRYALQAVPPIHIIVKNGNVILKGVVANEGDRNIAFIQARQVAGSFTVKNELLLDK